MSEPNKEQVAALRADVSDLAVNVGSLASQLSSQGKSIEEQTKKTRRDRIVLAVACIGLVLDLALSGLFWDIHLAQNCRNKHSTEFFQAEKQKVTGQITGLCEIVKASENQNPRQQIVPKSVDQVCSQYKVGSSGAQGFGKFILATQHYLDQIGTIEDQC